METQIWLLSVSTCRGGGVLAKGQWLLPCLGEGCPSNPHSEARWFGFSLCVPGTFRAAVPALDLRAHESVSEFAISLPSGAKWHLEWGALLCDLVYCGHECYLPDGRAFWPCMWASSVSSYSNWEYVTRQKERICLLPNHQHHHLCWILYDTSYPWQAVSPQICSVPGCLYIRRLHVQDGRNTGMPTPCHSLFLLPCSCEL